MACSKVLNFTDPCPYMAAIRAADMEILPTTQGEFRAELTQVTLNELWMQRFSESLPRVHKGTVRGRRNGFTFLTEAQPELHNRGTLWSPGEICTPHFEVQHAATLAKYRLGG